MAFIFRRMNLYNKSHTTKSCLNEGMSTLMWFVEIARKNITPKTKDETVGTLCLFEHLSKKTQILLASSINKWLKNPNP